MADEALSDARHRSLHLAATAWLCAVAMGGAAMGAEPRDPVTAAFATGGGDGLRLSLSRDGGTVLLRASADGGASALSVVCALCTREELLVAARSLGAQIAAREASRDPCRLEVGGLPDGAAVRVDGVPGRADGVPMIVEPGRHDVRAIGGGALRTGTVALEPGEAGHLEWSDMETISPRRRTARVAIASGGLGLALAAAGTALLFLDGDCATAPDTTGRCDKLHHLAPLGWSFIGTGAAAVLFGVVYGIASSRADGPSPDANEVAP